MFWNIYQTNFKDNNEKLIKLKNYEVRKKERRFRWNCNSKKRLLNSKGFDSDFKKYPLKDKDVKDNLNIKFKIRKNDFKTILFNLVVSKKIVDSKIKQKRTS